MKSINILLLILILFFNHGTKLCYAKEIQSLNYNAEGVESIYIKYSSGQGVPEIIDEAYKKKHFEFQVNDKQNIKYIIHYLNSISMITDEEKVMGGGDASFMNILIKKNNDVIDEMGFVLRCFFDADNNEYIVHENEYKRFLDFIYNLKTKKIVLNDEISFEPSDWAKTDIDKAIEKELVPKWNQIDYKNNITRLEVCQLVDNLLNIKGYTGEKTEKSPFEDTNDVSVISLYNKGIIDGKSATEFCPYDFITREELAKILSNVYSYMSDDVNMGDSIKYKDRNEISDWAVNDVIEMTSLGIFNGDEQGMFNPKANTTKEQVILTLYRISDIIK